MGILKISIITAVFNRDYCVADALLSVYAQNWSNVEHVLVDGGSTDRTNQVIHEFLDSNVRSGYVANCTSQPDFGIYDALNKGINRATGDVIGLMHSDDFFADSEVLSSVAMVFENPDVDAVYGDLDYVAKVDSKRIIRRWRSGDFSQDKLARGWMPPHPTLFLRRNVIDRWGVFDTRYKIAADYDFILRCLGQGKIRIVYIPRVLVKMRLGGESNYSLRKICLKTKEDYLALRRNHVGGIWALICKNVSKLGQFF